MSESRLRFLEVISHYQEKSKKLQDILNYRQKKELKLLEIGCGAGDIVSELLKIGYNAFGTDVEFKDSKYTKSLISRGKILKIGSLSLSRKTLKEKSSEYSFPFKTNTFDLTFSESTIEHVENLDDFVLETARVTKSGGLSIHYFPSRFSIIEPHIGIPLGGIIRSKFYYQIMNKLGLSFKRYRTSNGASECIDFIRSATFYKSRLFYISLFKQYGLNLKYDGAEGILIAKVYRNSTFARILKKSRLLIWLFKYCRSNVYIFEKG